MCKATSVMTRLLTLVLLCLSASVQAQQRETIPDLVAKGAVAALSTVPSGPTPSVADLLRITDVVVKGTIGQPRSYLSDDQRDIYTDYPISDPVFIYQSQMTTSRTPGVLPTVTVTLRGGTVMVNGLRFTATEPALRPLQPGSQALFLLQHVGDKYQVAGWYFGAFGIQDGSVIPLNARRDFAPEYRNVAVSDAVDSMMAALRTQVRLPK
jgi:hypothetical protein